MQMSFFMNFQNTKCCLKLFRKQRNHPWAEKTLSRSPLCISVVIWDPSVFNHSGFSIILNIQHHCLSNFPSHSRLGTANWNEWDLVEIGVLIINSLVANKLMGGDRKSTKSRGKYLKCLAIQNSSL